MKTRTYEEKPKNNQEKVGKNQNHTSEKEKDMQEAPRSILRRDSLKLISSVYFPKSSISKRGENWILKLNSGKRINLGNRYLEAIENILDFFKNKKSPKIKM